MTSAYCAHTVVVYCSKMLVVAAAAITEAGKVQWAALGRHRDGAGRINCVRATSAGALVVGCAEQLRLISPQLRDGEGRPTSILINTRQR